MFLLFRASAIVVAIGLLFSFIFRVLFYFTFKTSDLGAGWVKPLLALVHGLRFDFSALVFLNLFFILLIFFNRIRKNKIFLSVWAFANTAYILLLISDFVYYSLYSSRLGWDFLAVFNGLNADILFSMLSQFLILIPILGVCFYLYRLLLFRLFLNQNVSISLLKYPIYFLCVAMIFVFGYRGGFQKRVLSVQHTWLYSGGQQFFASMTSNTLHNLLRSKKTTQLPENFKNAQHSYLPVWNPEVMSVNSPLETPPKNILFIFIESLSSYSYENDKLPNLKQWVQENRNDLYFNTDFYANGNLSKDALVSVFFGLPSYFGVHYFESKYSKNTFNGIGQIAKQSKRKSFFLHAAPAGTQFFDVISKAAGFDKYESINDSYKGDPKLMGTWGVHDEVLYNSALNYIEKIDQPFIGTLFTTSTHTPFSGTPNNTTNSGDQEEDYFFAVNYADKALVDFLNKVTQTSWYKDTLFVITSDHSPPISSDWNRQLQELSRIPCILFYPNSNLNALPFKEVGRHVDIPKTLFHLLGEYPSMWTPYGESLVKTDSDSDSNVFYTSSNSINLVVDQDEVLTKSVFDEDLSSEKSNETKIANKDREPSSLKDQKIDLSKFKLIQKVNSELKDYVYRLEKNSIYK